MSFYCERCALTQGREDDKRSWSSSSILGQDKPSNSRMPLSCPLYNEPQQPVEEGNGNRGDKGRTVSNFGN